MDSSNWLVAVQGTKRIDLKVADKRDIGVGILLLGALTAIAYFLFGKNIEEDTKPKEETPPESFSGYDVGKSFEAERGGRVMVAAYCEEKFAGNRTMIDACISREHGKMMVAIANHNYTNCVTAYKRCHDIPPAGWERDPYDFCSDAIINYKEHSDPVITQIVNTGGKIAVTPSDVAAGETIHPDAFSWITTYTDCESIKCDHYGDYQRGWVHASLQLGSDFSKSSEKFYDRVMEHAGMREKWLGRGWKW